MPSLGDNLGPLPSGPGYSVAHQRVELDIDFQNRILKGNTEITIHPHRKDLKSIHLNFRQGELKRVAINGKIPTVQYTDPYLSIRLYGVHQHHKLSSKLGPLASIPPDPELTIAIPKTIRIEELDPLSLEAQTQSSLRPGGATDEPTDASSAFKPGDVVSPRFTAITVNVEFIIDRPRDGIQFVGVDICDPQYPHVFTTNFATIGKGCCLFPCVQTLSSRCTWDISITCARTLGDALCPHTWQSRSGARNNNAHTTPKPGLKLNSEDQSMEMVIACSGDLTDEIIDTNDKAKKTASFSCSTPLSALQIGFAIGPFEYINLAQFRESDEDDQLGQNAVPIHAFCLPGRANEIRNTCFPLAKAIDFISLNYGSYPFSSYKLCFIDNAAQNTYPYAALAVCSNRLLFPDDILDPLYESTRCLVHALASQWVGINIIPREPTDNWVIIGVAYYITDTFMRKLCGNNEFRYRLKSASDQICELDIARPSIWAIGALLNIDTSELELVSLKSPLVLYILERRLSKASGKATVSRILSRIFLNGRMGDMPNNSLTTTYFQKLCERFGHVKLDSFFQQWIYGAGCPRFIATQRFNKKKLVVEMMIRQVQSEMVAARDLDESTFMRDVKEELQSIYAGNLQHVFTGSMTIRIHEADGTPYEHIVEIKEAVTKFDIPYNTKYKRLKRNRRQKERVATLSGIDLNSELQDDTLLYCLGDVLQSEEEMQKWRLVDWTKEDEDRMGQESYEWIRMDADFEWICKMSLTMPGYMYLSQLQQDRDVVAQLESIQYMAAQREHPLISTIFVRTLMDKRYFYGIRTAAAQALVKHAKEDVDWIGLFHLENAFQELFCLHNSPMTRSNDFSDLASYVLQISIPQAISNVKKKDGKAPLRVQKFLYEKLKFNDNSSNKFSDCQYVATLMQSIVKALLSEGEVQSSGLHIGLDQEIELQAESRLRLELIEELNRYKRMDEWASSFQNIYTRTAIDCLRRLMKNGAIDVDLTQFLPYTRLGTFDMLRLDAFRALLELGIFKHPELLRWLLYTMSTDSSAWIRQELFRAFGRSLANVAFGKESDENEVSLTSDLVIEQESSTNAREAKLARKQTIPGALDALKNELSGNTALRDAIWSACNSRQTSLNELNDLLCVCSILYEPIDQMIIRLKYSKCWRAEHLGDGKMRFSKSGQYRTGLSGRSSHSPIHNSNHGVDKRKRNDSHSTSASRKITLKVPKLGLLPSPSDPATSFQTGSATKLKLRVKVPTNSNTSPM
ncbi:Transcription initiation factor TFIID subunit 2 [Ophidiomyces ophidiicola]|nr:Transcription initiation factor TFIID subunit 2 [Ophidiomyces ophidiicola]